MTFPNQLTLLRIVLTPIAAFFLLTKGMYALQIATVIFIIASLTDWYDGHIARKYGYVSTWGKFLDPLADKILISTMLFGFVILKYIKFFWVIIIVLRDLFITALRGYMIARGKSLTASRLAQWKTFCQVGLIYALLIFLNIEYFLGTNASISSFISLPALKFVIDIYVIFVALFTFITGIIYLFKNRTSIYEIYSRLCQYVIPVRLVSNGKSNTPIYSQTPPNISSSAQNTIDTHQQK
jgi:CDP-diacylglycerol--glycerol-3-phosphate 3-phosphatidyltransferase